MGCTGQRGSSGHGRRGLLVPGGTFGGAEGNGQLQPSVLWPCWVAQAWAGAGAMLLLLLKFGFAGGVHGWVRAVPERGWL